MHACGTLSFCPCSVMQKKTITSIFKLHVHRTLYAYICTWGPHLHSELLDDAKQDVASYNVAITHFPLRRNSVLKFTNKQTLFVVLHWFAHPLLLLNQEISWWRRRSTRKPSSVTQELWNWTILMQFFLVTGLLMVCSPRCVVCIGNEEG